MARTGNRYDSPETCEMENCGSLHAQTIRLRFNADTSLGNWAGVEDGPGLKNGDYGPYDVKLEVCNLHAEALLRTKPGFDVFVLELSEVG